MKKPFKSWTRQELKKVFGLIQVDNFAPLNNWVDAANITLSDIEIDFLDKLLKKSIRYADSWNETELREKFIIKILELVDFDNEPLECHTFAERYLSATINHYTLYGFVDWFVATGTQYPETPFFFIHEFKAEGAKEIDGRGQLLATMMATNALNGDNLPMYGTFVQGRLWFFLTSHGLEFGETSAFDVLKKDDLHQVVKILKQQKAIIDTKLQNGITPKSILL
jgi:hypothetical protein